MFLLKNTEKGCLIFYFEAAFFALLY